MKLNKIIQKLKDFMETKVYLDTHSSRQPDLIWNGEFTNGTILREAFQEQLKLVTCEADFKLLNNMMVASGYGHTTYAKRSGNRVPSINPYGWQEFKQDNGTNGRWEVVLDPLRCTYIVDGDNRRRKCLWKNLWKSVEIVNG